MNLREVGTGIMLSVAVGGALYSGLLATGWVVGEPQVQALAGTIVNARVNSESAERLEFQIEYKLSELRRYEAIPEHERTAADRVQIQELNKQIVWLQGQLRKARGQE